jgi:citrate synthase
VTLGGFRHPPRRRRSHTGALHGAWSTGPRRPAAGRLARTAKYGMVSGVSRRDALTLAEPQTREGAMPQNTLSVTDNRSGRSYELPITDGAIDASLLGQIKVGPDDLGLIAYDPALRHTATCRSAITYQDPRRGILRYRGYPIEQLAAHSTYLEVAYLIFNGTLPSAAQFAQWEAEIAANYFIHEKLTRFLDGFLHDAHPMGVLVSTVAALSTFFPDASDVHDPAGRRRQVLRLIAQVPTLAAFAHRRRVGMPYAYPDMELSYIGNFLGMMFKMTELRYEPNPIIERALDVLFILHADHGQACSTTTMRCVGSAKTDPYCAAAAAAAALYGRFHGEGFEAVLKMLEGIGSPEHIPAFLDRVKSRGEEPPGFGHRLYRTYDPRARILRAEAERVFAVTGRPQIFDIALRLDEMAATDPYFIEHALYPIVDYYEAIIYHAMGFPRELFPVLFAIPRFIGWGSQWDEMFSDPNQRTYRPRQIYTGSEVRDYAPIEQRR